MTGHTKTGTDSDQPAIDLQQLSEILGEQDKGELFDLLDFFVDQFPGLLGSLQGAVADRNARAVRDRAHAAKSAATSAAAAALSELLQRLEKTAENKDWSDIIAQADAITVEYGRVEAFCINRGEGA